MCGTVERLRSIGWYAPLRAMRRVSFDLVISDLVITGGGSL
jgi:hypothetical protein